NQPLTSKIRAMGTQAKLIHRDGTVEALSVPIAAGDNFYRIPLPPASAEVDDLQPGHYIIGGETFILVEDGVGKPIELGPNQVFYPITGHFVANGFLDHFRKNGGLAIFGYPRTAEITEGGKTVQYFQRARME